MAGEPIAPVSSPVAPPRPRWRDRLASPWLAALILVLFYGALLGSLRDKSATYDEPGHIASGYSYWLRNDYRLDPENGNLSKRWMALPLLLRSDRFPEPTSTAWNTGSSWIVADSWFNRLGNDAPAMLAPARAMAALVAVALGAVVWFWARRLFGPLGGLFSLLLYVTSPIVLANGGLTTSDTPAALGFLASLGCIWAILQRITVWRVLGGMVAIAGLFLAKMSAPLLLVMAFILVLARFADGRPLPVGDRLLARHSQQLIALAGVALVQTLGIVLLVWAAYGFRYSAFSSELPSHQRRFKEPWEWYLAYTSPREIFAGLNLTPEQQRTVQPRIVLWPRHDQDWSHTALRDFEEFRARLFTSEQKLKLAALLRPEDSMPLHLIAFAREHRLLPEAFLAGYAHVWRTSTKASAFLNGEVRQTGWWYFFPYVFAIKTPLAFFGLLGIAVAVCAITLRRRLRTAGSPARAGWDTAYPFLPLAILFVCYWGVALTSNLNLGHRHLLPAYLPLFIAGGALALLAAQSVRAAFAPPVLRRLTTAALALGVIGGAEIVYRFPNYIAYFNGVVMPERAYRHVVDSSLDWGQELPAISRYLAERPGSPAFLAYFGVDEPANHDIKAQRIGGSPGTERFLYPHILHLRETEPAKILEFIKQHPQYDPDLVLSMGNHDGAGVLLVQHSSALRLSAGLYVFSATVFQPPLYVKPGDKWSEQNETYYRSLQAALQPFFTDDRSAKIAALPKNNLKTWAAGFDDYYAYRLARLTHYLRQREPDDIINYSVLVYRLSEADLRAALEQPARP